MRSESWRLDPEGVKLDALAIFADIPSETPQVVHDIIEWYYARMLVASERQPQAEQPKGCTYPKCDCTRLPSHGCARGLAGHPDTAQAEKPAQALTDEEFDDLCADLWNEHMVSSGGVRRGTYEHFQQCIRAALASAPRVPQPLDMGRITEGFHQAHPVAPALASIDDFRLGVRFAERAHGIAAAPQPEGGAS